MNLVPCNMHHSQSTGQYNVHVILQFVFIFFISTHTLFTDYSDFAIMVSANIIRVEVWYMLTCSSVM
jgi:hypothetical protein